MHQWHQKTVQHRVGGVVASNCRANVCRQFPMLGQPPTNGGVIDAKMLTLDLLYAHVARASLKPAGLKRLGFNCLKPELPNVVQQPGDQA